MRRCALQVLVNRTLPPRVGKSHVPRLTLDAAGDDAEYIYFLDGVFHLSERTLNLFRPLQQTVLFFLSVKTHLPRGGGPPGSERKGNFPGSAAAEANCIPRRQLLQAKPLPVLLGPRASAAGATYGRGGL
ncbi:hypothetical protein VULLAG_LOCUS4332 [Vulpes lagopus]